LASFRPVLAGFRLPWLAAGALWMCSSAWSHTVLENAALLGMSAEQVAGVLGSADADVMLFRSGRPSHPSLRVVIRQRQRVDAGEL
jgi:hypothetical protein